MTDTRTRFSIPDVALHCIGGGDIDPASLRGQKVAIYFCPTDPDAAAREIEDYRGLAEQFADAGVWLIGVLEGPAPPRSLDSRETSHILLAEDADGRGWRYFEPALGGPGKPDRSAGAAFFFERWGSLRHAWPAAGHAREMLAVARQRN